MRITVGGCMRAKTAKPIAASAIGIVRKASNFGAREE
jgi:hypothetical protein